MRSIYDYFVGRVAMCPYMLPKSNTFLHPLHPTAICITIKIQIYTNIPHEKIFGACH